MDNFTHVINSLLQIIIDLGNIIVGGILTIEFWLRGQLTQFGLPSGVQTLILLALAVLLILGALRLFGGLIRIAIILALILIVIHIVMPVVQH